MSEYLKLYEVYLKETRKSCSNTINSYLNDVSSFIRYFGCDDKTLLTIEKNDIETYIKQLLQSGKSCATATRRIAAIRSFYHYLETLSLLEKNPVCQIILKKAEKKLPAVLSVEEVDRLLNEPSEEEPKGLRDKAMLALIYATGLKTSEIISLDTEDVNFALAQLKCGSGADCRVIPIYSEAVRLLQRYVTEIRTEFLEDNKEKALFVNVSGKRMTRQGFWKIVKSYSSRLGIDNIAPHTLRHSFAVHLLSNGAELRDIQKMLGHNDISTTQIYSRVLEDSLSTAYRKFHPKSGI